MQLIRLVYVSRMTEECDMEALQNILEVSRQNNPAIGVTGLLCYDPAFFLQCLEGPRDTVNDLYAKIVADDRHTNVTLLDCTDIDERFFGNWAMGLLKTSDVDKDTIVKFTGSERFDPYGLKGETVLDFLVAVFREQGGS